MLCIIPARGGSRRIPRKSVRLFYGKPIITYSISLAQSAGLDVFVSTDDAAIAQIAKDFGARVIQRPFELAEDSVGTQEVMAHAMGVLGMRKNTRVACLYPCAPLLDLEYFIAGRPGKGYAVTVGTNPLRDAGAAYWGDSKDFKVEVPLYNISTRLIPLAEEDVIDINTEEDWFVAENRYALKHGLTPQHSGTVPQVSIVEMAARRLTPDEIAKSLGGFVENGTMVIP